MSLLLEILGNGLLGDLLSAFESQLPDVDSDELQTILARRRASPRSVDLALRHGVAALRAARLAEARGAFEDARRHSRSPVKPALGLACVHDEQGRLDLALEQLSVARDADPDDPAVAFAVAFCDERAGRTDRAVDGYRHSISLCPRLRNAYERLAAIALRRGDLDESRRCYEQLAEIEPDDVEILTSLAALNLATGRPLEAIPLFERALLIEPQCTEEELGDLDDLSNAAQLHSAIDRLAAMAKKYPGIPEFHVHLGDLRAKAGQADAALQEYEAALQAQPRYLEALIKLGTQQLRMKRHVDAAQSFNRAMELNDRVMTAYIGLGVAQEAAGRSSEAAATFDLATGIDPNATLLFAEAARLQLKAERDDRRERLGHEMLEPPADGTGEDLLAEQVRRHQQALALRPEQADLHYRCGLLARQTGDLDAAIGSFRDALAIQPSYLKSLIKLGVSLRLAGRPAEALDVFRQALSLNERVCETHYELGLLFAQRNRFDLTVDELERATGTKGGAAAHRANIALGLQSIGMLDRASATWRSMCELTREFEDAGSEAASVAGVGQ